jgi:hypothetical protein
LIRRLLITTALKNFFPKAYVLCFIPISKEEAPQYLKAPNKFSTMAIMNIQRMRMDLIQG